MSTNKKNDVPINFSTVWDNDYWMKSNDMYCGFNMPVALVSNKNGSDEFAHGLPPYAKRKFYLSDEYPAVPKNWVPSEGRKTSYFVPVKENFGMWLDFNKNWNHKYHVAIVVSVQGINPITGMPVTSAGLEQYIDKCPKHDKPFGAHRFCSECGYKWPKQNYICTTGTPNGNLWLDGFKTAEGVVRQYVLTMDKIRGVASNIIKEDRVFAVGVSFFLSNNPKPEVQQVTRSRMGLISSKLYCNDNIGYAFGNTKGITKSTISDSDNSSATMDWMECAAPVAGAAAASSQPTQYSCDNVKLSSLGGIKSKWASIKHLKSSHNVKRSKKTGEVLGAGGSSAGDCDSIQQPLNSMGQVVNSTAFVRSIDVEKVEIGAGANINQQVYDDPEPLDFWRKEPESVILINYCLESDAEKIIKAGKISLEGHKESFLKDVPTGNVLVEK